jgi:hypothetical protein
MPCPPDVLKRADEIVDKLLAERKDEIRANYLAQQDIDGKTLPVQYRPQQDHQNKRIDELWGPKPRVPIPIETI